MSHVTEAYPNVTSRYESTREIAEMQRMLGALSKPVLRRIDSVFCDSKACACYSIELNEAPTPLIAEEIDDAFLRISDGHNGIALTGPGGAELFVDPNWKQDWVLS